MSADNWATCPVCQTTEQFARQGLLRAAQESYGKVPPDRYMELLREAEEVIQQGVNERSFHEDYEIGIDEGGTFSVSYSGFCTKCGTSFEFAGSIGDFRHGEFIRTK